MSWPSVSFRSELPAVMRKELDQFSAQITGVLSPEHHADGTHGPITADAIAVRGNATIGGKATIGGAATVGGDLTVGGAIASKGGITAGGPIHTPSLQIGAGAPLTTYTEAAYTPQAMGHTGAPLFPGAPSSLTGWYSQLGTAVTFEVRLLLGTGFIWPPGEALIFSLPKPRLADLMSGLSTMLHGPIRSYAIGGGLMWTSVANSVLLTLPAAVPAYSGQIALAFPTTPFAAAAGNLYGFVGTYRTTGA
jgi:hypothetical protein